MKKIILAACLSLIGVANAQVPESKLENKESATLYGEVWDISLKINGNTEHDAICLNNLQTGFLDTFSVSKMLMLNEFLELPGNSCTEKLETTTTNDRKNYKLETTCNLPNNTPLESTRLNNVTNLKIKSVTSASLNKSTNIVVGDISLDASYRYIGDKKTHKIDPSQKPDIKFVLLKHTPAQRCKFQFDDISNIDVSEYQLVE